ncbi:FG-GAP repeat protein [Leptospira wolbachii serovar Codice str. CDC]|uniref:FG-GAP repeat protein n=1 Tax=Leptospira wolbachii serovar Codice str. CDC TaxID=1218599 RepID=R9A2V7_9LEPT|nr:FG-GAP repeat protein [Leptospira wolbachii]EOQ96299.1 FG-GAP repeat protein [Leptospira wolbachii serovar Codice str. CDC]
MGKRQFLFRSFLTKKCVLILLLISYGSCRQLTLNNPCDQKSKSYAETLLLATLSETPIPFCGFRVSSAPKLWEAQAYLKASNAEANDFFGFSVAISRDTIVVGASGEASNQTTISNGPTASGDNSALRSGAVYVFQRSGNSWTQEAYLKASNAEVDDRFGISVAIDGDTIAVGANEEDSNQTTITNGLPASNDNNASNSGAVYVFQRTGSTWVEQAYIKPPNTGVDDQFGVSISISGDTIAVGSFLEDSIQTTITNGPTATGDDSATQSGAAYVFQRSGSTWSQQAYLKASNAQSDDRFGVTVSISGDTIVVGANLEDSNQTTITNGATASSDNSATQSGAAYVFQRTGSTWVEQAYLKPPNAEANDQFGQRVAISKDTIVVGSFSESSNQTTISNGQTASTNNSAALSGAAYVFQRIGSTWTHQAYLKAPNTEADDRFGISLAIEGDTILVGAIFEDSNQTTVTNGQTASEDNSITNAGAVYVFQRSGSNWFHRAYIKPPNPDLDDRFGNAVAISGDTMIVSANQEDSNQNTITNGPTASTNNLATNSGAGYVFIRK